MARPTLCFKVEGGAWALLADAQLVLADVGVGVLGDFGFGGMPDKGDAGIGAGCGSEVLCLDVGQRSCSIGAGREGDAGGLGGCYLEHSIGAGREVCLVLTVQVADVECSVGSSLGCEVAGGDGRGGEGCVGIERHLVQRRGYDAHLDLHVVIRDVVVAAL